MLNGLYSAAAGMNAFERMHEVVAENLAHIGVPGYRANVLTFHLADGTDDSSSDGLASGENGRLAEELTTDFTPGPLALTGRSLDVAISGEGFFVLQGPEGPLYTRNGAFFLDSTRRLVSGNNLPVEGQGGTLTFPPDTSAEEIHIGQDGSVSVRGRQIGQLRIVTFEDVGRLERAGTALFSASLGANPQDGSAIVLQGSRELSNVSAVQEMVRMIVGTRQYEAAQRVITALDESVANNTNPQT
jgi:flagellar basal body rod protein FlgG